jgi:Protein of unknown function (DUF2934)
MAEKKAAKKAGAKKASSAKKAAPAKKAATGAKKKATSSKRAAKAPTHDEIARRAYEIHEREGGNHEQNWLRAERELGGG